MFWLIILFYFLIKFKFVSFGLRLPYFTVFTIVANDWILLYECLAWRIQPIASLSSRRPWFLGCGMHLEACLKIWCLCELHQWLRLPIAFSETRSVKCFRSSHLWLGFYSSCDPFHLVRVGPSILVRLLHSCCGGEIGDQRGYWPVQSQLSNWLDQHTGFLWYSCDANVCRQMGHGYWRNYYWSGQDRNCLTSVWHRFHCSEQSCFQS